MQDSSLFVVLPSTTAVALWEFTNYEVALCYLLQQKVEHL
jgi:hypothetical protein